MKLDNLIKLRRKKKISRSKLALDLNIDIDTIKELETTDIINVDNKLLSNIADYFNITIEELSGVSQINISNSIPKDVELHQVSDLCSELLDKYNIHLDDEKRRIMLSEFKYRIGDLTPIPPSDKDKQLTYIKETSPEFSELLKSITDVDTIEDEDIDDVKEIRFLLDKDLNFDKDITRSIRRDAKTIATFYKELLINDLSEIECLNILRAFMTCYYDV